MSQTASNGSVLWVDRISITTISKQFIFDTQFYCKSDNFDLDAASTGVLASLKFFNSADIPLQEISAYFITACVVKTLPMPNNNISNFVSSDQLSYSDYCIVGDTISLIPASLPMPKILLTLRHLHVLLMLIKEMPRYPSNLLQNNIQVTTRNTTKKQQQTLNQDLLCRYIVPYNKAKDGH
ncbi:hypothetical protein BDQ17DRAFT_1421518 [Cyathus striatus]|nr:hypothetical protein BDQ17DRAFT_1421518 [Cyathus striatus]